VFSGVKGTYSTEAEAARNYLINTFHWTIADGGKEDVSIIHEDDIDAGSTPPGVYFDTNPASLQNNAADIFVLTGAPARLAITIYDMTGNVIDTQQSPAFTKEGGRFTWNMRNRQGMRVSAGSYGVIATAEYENGQVEQFRSVLGLQE
jgi:hypothetical protein